MILGDVKSAQSRTLGTIFEIFCQMVAGILVTNISKNKANIARHFLSAAIFEKILTSKKIVFWGFGLPRLIFGSKSKKPVYWEKRLTLAVPNLCSVSTSSKKLPRYGRLKKNRPRRFYTRFSTPDGFGGKIFYIFFSSK